MRTLEHGTMHGYNKHMCRCDECRAAWNSYMKSYRNNRKALPDGYVYIELKDEDFRSEYIDL